MSETRYLYVATQSTSDNYTSLAYYQKDTELRMFGGFIEGKPYICWRNDKNLLFVGGFFNMEKEIKLPRKSKKGTHKIVKAGIGWFTLEFEPEVAAKFLKFQSKIEPKGKR